MPVPAGRTLSPEFEGLLANLWAQPLPDDLSAMRAAYDQMGAQFPPDPAVTRRDASLAGRPAVWFEPEAPEAGVILYLHGGGYSIGSIASHAHMGDGLSLRTGRGAVLLDYRLAPEHPYPAGLDDAYAAYETLIADGSPVALVGDSAGAGLVAAVMSKARASGLPPPACAYLMSPWVDLTLTSPTIVSKAAVDPFASEGVLAAMVSRYIGDRSPSEPLVSPALASFGAETPVLIQVGSAEALMADSLKLAQALGEADAPVELQIWSRMIHVWPWLYPVIPEGEDAFSQGCDFIRRHMR